MKVKSNMGDSDRTDFLRYLTETRSLLTCSVCKKIFDNPVKYTTCFHTVCKSHTGDKGIRFCTVCKVGVHGTGVVPDLQLKDMCEAVLQLEDIYKNGPGKNKKSGLKKQSKSESGNAADKSNNQNITANSALECSNECYSSNDVSLTKCNSTADEMNHSKLIFSEKSAQMKKERMETICTAVHEAGSAKKKSATKSINHTGSESPKLSIEKKNVKGETPLHIACRRLNMDRILDLLEKGANPNTTDNAGWTPLHEVTQKGSLDAVKLLLNYKALSDVPGLDNETPLHEAVRFRFQEIAMELVKYGANINAKNIRGETPLSLADDKMKEVLLEASSDIILTQSENIKEISLVQMETDLDNMHIFCNVPSKTFGQKLKNLAKKHNIVIEEKFSNEVTHLVVETEEDNIAISTIEVLHAIVNCIWILNSKWITKTNQNRLEPFEQYEVAGIIKKELTGHKKARLNRYKKLPGLFDGCHFYFHNFTKEYEISKSLILSKSALIKIVTDAGGKVLRRVPNPEAIPQSENTVPYHALPGSKLAKCSHFIIFTNIYQPMYNMQHLKALPVGWLIECIHKYEICDP